MPIKPENRWLYPKTWPEIRRRILGRAENRCELCDAKDGEPHPITGSTVILTIMHLNHIIGDCRAMNLKAACQRCHNRYDLQFRIENRKREKGDQLLLGEERGTKKDD